MNKTRRNKARKRRAALRRLAGLVDFSKLLGATKDIFPPYYFADLIPSTDPALQERLMAARDKGIEEHIKKHGS